MCVLLFRKAKEVTALEENCDQTEKTNIDSWVFDQKSKPLK